MQQEDIDVRQLSKESLPHWQHLSREQVRFQRMVSISNQVFKVTGEGVPPIIFRKFGRSCENYFLARESESEIYNCVSAAGLGPRILFACETFRIEEYIPSVRLQIEQMLQADVLRKMAFAIRQFHELKPDNAPVSQNCLNRRILVCREKLDQYQCKEEEKELVRVLKGWISEEEFDFIDQLTVQLEQFGLKLCHNDILANNILVRPCGNLLLIDYEFAAYSYPIYDIAYYLNEASIDLNHQNSPFFKIFPSAQAEHKRSFLQAYVVAGYGAEQFEQNYETLRQSAGVREVVDKLQKILPIGQMLAHIIWASWAILVLEDPLIKIDKLAFAKYRYERYMELKNVL